MDFSDKNNTYETLKNALDSRLVATEQPRLRLLLDADKLGDRRLSQLLCHLQQLLGDKTAFMDRLWRNVAIWTYSGREVPDHARLPFLGSSAITVAIPAGMPKKLRRIPPTRCIARISRIEQGSYFLKEVFKERSRQAKTYTAALLQNMVGPLRNLDFSKTPK
ncbi:hypothetical protein ISCGN_008396 [Ixodes scapularis]